MRFRTSAPSPGKDHLCDSVFISHATAGRLQLVQTFTVFQATNMIRMHLSLQQQLWMKQPRVRKSVVPLVWTILAGAAAVQESPQPTQGRAAAAELLLQTDLQFSCGEDKKFSLGQK